MSLITRNLAGMLQNAGLGTVATDIFVEKLTTTPDNAIMVMTNGGQPPDVYLDTMYINVEFWVRDKSTKTAGDKLDAIYRLLHRNHHFTLGDYYIYFVSAQGNIDVFSEDSQGRKLAKQTYQVIYRDTRTVS